MTPSQTQPNFASDAERFACFAARVAADNRCEQVLTMHVAGISQVTEYLVIATGTSQRQLKSVAEEMRDLAKQEGQSVFRSDAGDGTGWVVIDFVDVVVHLFTAEQRAFYDLESLWGDGKQVDWVNRTTPGQFARLSSRRATVE